MAVVTVVCGLGSFALADSFGVQLGGPLVISKLTYASFDPGAAGGWQLALSAATFQENGQTGSSYGVQLDYVFLTYRFDAVPDVVLTFGGGVQAGFVQGAYGPLQMCVNGVCQRDIGSSRIGVQTSLGIEYAITPGFSLAADSSFGVGYWTQRDDPLRVSFNLGIGFRIRI